MDNLQTKLDELKDPFNREGFEIKKIYMKDDVYPDYLMKNLSKYYEYIYNGDKG
jgi:hypothetical protein